MNAPSIVLWSDANIDSRQGSWRFVIQRSDGSTLLEAEDLEPDMRGERLELLSVVRGLEALDGPSQVTLVTASGYVRRGLKYGLESWRRSGFTWESFGAMTPVKNADLWQRLDRASSIHELRCLRLPRRVAAAWDIARSKAFAMAPCVLAGCDPRFGQHGRSASPWDERKHHMEGTSGQLCFA